MYSYQVIYGVAIIFVIVVIDLSVEDCIKYEHHTSTSYDNYGRRQNYYHNHNGYQNEIYFTYICENIHEHLYEYNLETRTRNLTIIQSVLTEIVSGFFRDLPNLRHLTIFNSTITTIKEGAFNRLSNLKFLNLSSNRIQNMSNGVFSSLINLATLDLSHNDISEVEAHLFLGMPSLKYFYINDNNISNMLPLLASCEELVFVDLSCNKINNIEFRQSCQQLKYLNISHNNIQNLTNNISRNIHLTNSATLDLSDNNITAVEDGSFSGMTNLGYLYINNNNILNMLPLLASCEALFFVDFSSNMIKNIELPHSCQQLKYLIINHNEIQNLTSSMFINISLSSLDISSNNFKYIAKDHFKYLSSLRYLNLSGNYLLGETDMAADLFQNVIMLRSLNLSSTGIKNIVVGTFSKLNKLEVLDLSFNNLKYLPTGIYHDLNSLSRLYLNGNKLRDFTYSGSIHLNEINLGGNLWNCKSLSSIIERMERDHENINIIRGNAYNGSNIYGIHCDGWDDDLDSINMKNFTDINSFYKEYFGKFPQDLKRTLLDLKSYLNDTNLDSKNFIESLQNNQTIRDLSNVQATLQMSNTLTALQNISLDILLELKSTRNFSNWIWSNLAYQKDSQGSSYAAKLKYPHFEDLDNNNTENLINVNSFYNTYFERFQQDLRQTFLELKSYLNETNFDSKNFIENIQNNQTLRDLSNVQTTLQMSNTLTALQNISLEILLELKNDRNFSNSIWSNYLDEEKNNQQMSLITKGISELLAKDNFSTINTQSSSYIDKPKYSANIVALYCMFFTLLAVFLLLLLIFYRKYKTCINIQDECNPLALSNLNV